MTPPPPIIGLILHFRTPEKTLACLSSLQREGVFHAVVIDNSEDKGMSVATMRKGINTLESLGMKVKVLHSEYNLGFSKGIAYGQAYIAKHLSGHILIINSDATLGKNSITNMKKWLDKAPIVAPQIAQAERQPSSSAAYYNPLFGLISFRPLPLSIKYFSGCCLLIHKNIINQPLFDQDFFFYGEDTFLGFQLIKEKLTTVECQDAIIYHATSSSAKNGSIFYEYHMTRAHWLLAKKLSKNKYQHSLFIFARCFSLPARATIRSLRNRSLTPWKGLLIASRDIFLGKFNSLTPPADL